MENTVTLELNVQNLNIVLAALAKLPLEHSLETFMVIKNQAEQQLNQPSDVPKGPLSDKVIV